MLLIWLDFIELNFLFPIISFFSQSENKIIEK